MCNYICPDQSVTNEDKFRTKNLKIDETASSECELFCYPKWISQKNPCNKAGEGYSNQKIFCGRNFKSRT